MCYKNKSNFQWMKKRQGSKEGKPFQFFFGDRIIQKFLFGSFRKAKNMLKRFP